MADTGQCQRTLQFHGHTMHITQTPRLLQRTDEPVANPHRTDSVGRRRTNANTEDIKDRKHGRGMRLTGVKINRLRVKPEPLETVGKKRQ